METQIPGFTAYIGREWRSSSKGEAFASLNPATGETLWKGAEATENDIHDAIEAASNALPTWSALPSEIRVQALLKLGSILQSEQSKYAEIIAKENGKPLWEAMGEVAGMINKIDLSINAYEERCRESIKPLNDAISITRHRPHGVVALLGPFNFPGYLPFGQIIPALLAGNCIVFKPSELTPWCGQALTQLIEKAEIPSGVFNLVQGGKSTGKLLVDHPKINGVFFVGSWNGGKALAENIGTQPEKILALEMGGNNPLVVTNVSDYEAAAYLAIQSAFLTSGQRCTCARRLIVPRGDKGDRFIQSLIKMTSKIVVGPYTQKPDPFMGPVISENSFKALLKAQEGLIAKGGKSLIEMKRKGEQGFFLTPGIIDVTSIALREDEEFFGPLLQLIRVDDFNTAIVEANNTAYGLTAGLLSDDKNEYDLFLKHVKAGIINWNMPMTGNSSGAPFGGIGKSGNNRPSGFYTIDYCNYPVASLEKPKVSLPAKLSPGLPI